MLIISTMDKKISDGNSSEREGKDNEMEIKTSDVEEGNHQKDGTHSVVFR